MRFMVVVLVTLVVALSAVPVEAQTGGWRVRTGQQTLATDILNQTLATYTCAGVWVDNVGCVVRTQQYRDIFVARLDNGRTIPFVNMKGVPIGSTGSAILGALIGAGGGYALGGDRRSTIGGSAVGALVGLVVDKATKGGEDKRYEQMMQVYARGGGQYPLARTTAYQQNPPQDSPQPQLPPPSGDIQTVQVPPTPPQTNLVTPPTTTANPIVQPMVVMTGNYPAVTLENGSEDWIEVFLIDSSGNRQSVTRLGTRGKVRVRYPDPDTGEAYEAEALVFVGETSKPGAARVMRQKMRVQSIPGVGWRFY